MCWVFFFNLEESQEVEEALVENAEGYIQGCPIDDISIQSRDLDTGDNPSYLHSHLCLQHLAEGLIQSDSQEGFEVFIKNTSEKPS